MFWKGRKDKDFKLNELLFDVAVCETEETKSIDKGRALMFVSRCLWLVESELASDSREIIIDLSKLVMGSSEYKLFVAGLGSTFLSDTTRRDRREREILKMCGQAADRCACDFYFCFIPHPSAWEEAEANGYGPSVWRWNGADWCKV